MYLTFYYYVADSAIENRSEACHYIKNNFDFSSKKAMKKYKFLLLDILEITELTKKVALDLLYQWLEGNILEKKV